MKALELTPVEIMTVAGVQTIMAYVDGPFAIHKRGKWKVSHLPSGFAFPFFFGSSDAALKYAAAIRPVRNDWWCIVAAEDISSEQRKTLHALAYEHGATWLKSSQKLREKADAQIKAMRPLSGMEQH